MKNKLPGIIFSTLIIILSWSFSGNAQSISGTVYSYYSGISQGQVIAIDTASGTMYTGDISEYGTFKIDSVPEGSYILLANPNQIYNNFDPTYYPNVPDSVSAYVINVSGDIIGLDLMVNGAPDVTAVNILPPTVEGIFPNPAKDFLQLRLSQEFLIYSLDGKEVFQGSAEMSFIDISYWERGLYILKMKNGNTYRFQKL